MARPHWTRKTYEMAAEAIKETLEGVDHIEGQLALERLAMRLGANFRTDNPRFDLHRFLSASGFGEK